MDRLTYYDDGKWRLRIGETEHSGPQVDRIAEFENILEGCDPIRLQELVQADRDGKCTIIPDFVCKIGEPIGIVKTPHKTWVGRFSGTEFFRAEKAADKALKGEKHG